MNIKINHYFDYSELVPIVVDGYCNHDGYDTEWDTNEWHNPNGQDMVQDVLTEICYKCGCYRNVYNEGKSQWFGIDTLPMIPVVNSGKVFSDVR